MSLLDMVRRKREEQQAEAKSTLAGLALKEAEGKATKADADRLAELVGDDDEQAQRYEQIVAQCRELVKHEQTVAALDGADTVFAEGRERIQARQAEVEQIIADAEQEQRDMRAELGKLQSEAGKLNRARAEAQAIRDRIAKLRGDVDEWAGRDLSTAVIYPDTATGPRANDLQPGQGPHLPVPAEVYQREMDRRRSVVTEARAAFDKELDRLMAEDDTRKTPTFIGEIDYPTASAPGFDPAKRARDSVIEAPEPTPAKRRRQDYPTGAGK